jgi:ribosome-binding ATPase YchF (GTP1/OBG family)
VKSKKTKPDAKCYTLYAIFAACLLICTAGCENANKKSPLAEQIQQLKQEKTELTRQIERSENENEQLQKQILVLSDLPEEAKAENLYRLQRVKVTRYTNFYDKDKDGQKEKLIVYIQPLDEEGDIVKATGAVDVQLWDLNKEANQALLGQWQVTPEQLKKLWFATLVTINYRLTFDVADKIGNIQEPLTVKVTFTDYLTGKVFKEQKVIRPQSI